MKPINGKTYPLWGQFVDRKAEWIGGTMTEHDKHCGDSPTEKIVDIRMEANGEESAMLIIDGETFAWRCDVGYLCVGPGSPPNGFNFQTYGGDSLTIIKPQPNQASFSA